MSKNTRKAVQGSNVHAALDQLKFETAQELGVQIGADQTSRSNGSVGGEMVRKMIRLAETQLGK